MKPWVSRIIEGLLIGLGIVVVMGAYNQIKTSTIALEGAAERIQSQEKINKQMLERIEINSKNYVLSKDLLADEMSKINNSIDRLATLVKKVGNKTPSATNLNSIDWNKLQSNSKNQIIVPEVEWFESNAEYKVLSSKKPLTIDWEKHNIDKSKYVSQDSELNKSTPFSLPKEESKAFESLGAEIRRQSEIPLK